MIRASELVDDVVERVGRKLEGLDLGSEFRLKEHIRTREKRQST